MIGGISFMKHPIKKFINSSYNFIMRIKNVFVFILLIMVLGPVHSQSPNPIVKRLSNQEIAECKTPAAITYNLICAILQKDFDKMRSYMDLRGMIYYTDSYIRKDYGEYGINSLVDYFSTGKLAILTWLPALFGEYEVAIAYVQDLWLYEEDGSRYVCGDNDDVRNGMVYLYGEEDNPRVVINEKKVYVTCSPSSEVNNVGFQDITSYGNLYVEIFLEQINGTWKVTGLD